MADVKEPVDNQFPKKVEEKRKAEEKETHISQKLRVLLIDDNVVCLSILASQLKHCGFQVTPITKASVALDLLRRNRNGFDIVVTDVVRFDINGFKLSEIISREFGIPVIMASAMDDKKTMEEGIRCGARDYLVKPVRVGILRNIWQHVIRTPYCCSPLPPINPPPADAMSMEANNNKTTHDGNSTNPNKRSHDDDDDEKKKKNKKVECEYISSSSEESPLVEKKPRVVWDARLHQKFLDAVFRLDVDRAVPKKILEMMNEPGLTRENVASHLQKFRNIIRKERERNMGMNPRDATTHVVNPMIQGAVLGNQGLTTKHINFCGGQEMGSFLQRSLHSGEQLKNMASNSMHQNVAPSSSSSLAIKSGIVSAIMRCPQIDRNQRNIFDLDFVQASPQLATTSSGLRHLTAGCLVVGNSIDDNLLKLNGMYSNSEIDCKQVEHTESSQAGVSINGENKHHPIMSAVAGTSFRENIGGHLSSTLNSIVSIQVGSTQTSQVAGSVGDIKHDHFMQPISDGSNSNRVNNAYFSSYMNNVVSHQVRPPQSSQSPGVSIGGIKCFNSDRGNNIIGHVVSYQAQSTQPFQADDSIGGIFKHDHLTQNVSSGSSGGSSNRGNHGYSLSSGNYVCYKVRPTRPSKAAGVSIGGIKHDHLTQPISDGNSNRGNNGSLSSSNNYFVSYQARSAPPSQVASSDEGIKHDHFTQPVSVGSSSNRGNNAYLSSCRNSVVTHEPKHPQPSQSASVSIGGIKNDHLTQPISAGGSYNGRNNGQLSSSSHYVIPYQTRPTQHFQTGGSIGGIKCDNLTKPISVDRSYIGNSGNLSSSDVVTHETMPTQPSQAGVFIGGIKEDHLIQPLFADSSDRGNNVNLSSSDYVVSHQARPTQSQASGSIGEILNDHLLSIVGSSIRGNNSLVSSINSTFPYQVGPFQASCFVGGNNGQVRYTQPCSQMGGSSVSGNNYDHLIQPLLAGNSGNNTGHLTQPYQATGSFVIENNNDHHGSPSLAASGENNGHNSFSQGENSSFTENKNGYYMQVLLTTDSSVNINGGNNDVQLSLPSGAVAGSGFVQGNNDAQAAEPIHGHSQSVVLTDNNCVGENFNGHQTSSVTEIYSNIESDVDDPPNEEISLLIKELSNYDTSPSIF